MPAARTVRSERGYTSLEILVVVAIFGLVSAMTALNMEQARPSMKGDGAMRTVIAQLNSARELSITERRIVEVSFTSGNVIKLIRRNIPTTNGTTLLAEIPIEGGVQFALTPGLPDTPDAFGNSSAVAFGSATSVAFNSDGTFIDQSGTPINGTVFLKMPGQNNRGSRAVTVLGATGRIRGYKWDGSRWVRL